MFIYSVKNRLTWLLLCLLPAASALACTPQFSKGQATRLLIDIGKRVVPASAPVGSPIYSKTFAWNAINDGGEQWLTCNNGHSANHRFDLKSMMSGATVMSQVYRSNLPGVGVRLSLRAPGGYDGFPAAATPSPFTETVSWQSTADNALDDAFHLGLLRVKVELLKIAPTVASGRLDYRDTPFLYAGETRVASVQLQGEMTVGACTPDPATPTQIKLPATDIARFGHTGSTAGETPFTLQLECNSAVGVKLRLDGREAPAAGQKGVLINSARSNPAQGVGVQVLYRHVPVALHQEIDTGLATEGHYTIPLNARYYQTQPQIGAGRVRSVATWTLVYY